MRLAYILLATSAFSGPLQAGKLSCRLTPIYIEPEKPGAIVEGHAAVYFFEHGGKLHQTDVFIEFRNRSNELTPHLYTCAEECRDWSNGTEARRVLHLSPSVDELDRIILAKQSDQSNGEIRFVEYIVSDCSE